MKFFSAAIAFLSTSVAAFSPPSDFQSQCHPRGRALSSAVVADLQPVSVSARRRFPNGRDFLEGEQMVRALIEEQLASAQEAGPVLVVKRANPVEIQVSGVRNHEETSHEAKYGAIDDIGERAFAILSDLGMIEVTEERDE